MHLCIKIKSKDFSYPLTKKGFSTSPVEKTMNHTVLLEVETQTLNMGALKTSLEWTGNCQKNSYKQSYKKDTHAIK